MRKPTPAQLKVLKKAAASATGRVSGHTHLRVLLNLIDAKWIERREGYWYITNYGRRMAGMPVKPTTVEEAKREVTDE